MTSMGTGRLTGIACSSTTLCVAFEKRWFPVLLDPSAPRPRLLRPMSANLALLAPTTGACVSRLLCVAAGGQSVVVTDDPTAATPDWSHAHVADQLGTDSLRSIACPTETDCLAVDDSGSVLATEHAMSVTPHWRLTPDVAGRGVELSCRIDHVRPCHALQAVACPSIMLCVAVGTEHIMVTSVDPFSPHPTWSRRGRPLAAEFTSISCPSVSRCVAADAADAAGHGEVSTDPSAPTPHWRTVDFGTHLGRAGDRFAEHSVNGISCPSATMCVAVDDHGHELLSTAPANAHQRWRDTPADCVGDACIAIISAVACPTASLCVAADAGGGVLTTTAPVTLWRHWVREQVDEVGNIKEDRQASGAGDAAVSCASSTQCVVVEADGREFESSDVGAPRPTWTRMRRIDFHAPVRGVACPTAGRCIAVDGRGRTITGSAPATR